MARHVGERGYAWQLEQVHFGARVTTSLMNLHAR